MKLKKLLTELVQQIKEKGFDESFREIQSLGMPKIKSGADAYIIAPVESGKSTLLAMGIIQQLKQAEGDVPRAIVLVKSKEDALTMFDLLEYFGANTNLRFFMVNDQHFIHNQKDEIYEGVDVVIGAPKRINELLSNSGIPLSNLRMLAVDDAESFFPNRNHPVIYRIADACPKAQFLIFANKWTDKFDILTERMMKNPEHIETD